MIKTNRLSNIFSMIQLMQLYHGVKDIYEAIGFDPQETYMLITADTYSDKDSPKSSIIFDIVNHIHKEILERQFHPDRFDITGKFPQYALRTSFIIERGVQFHVYDASLTNRNLILEEKTWLDRHIPIVSNAVRNLINGMQLNSATFIDPIDIRTALSFSGLYEELVDRLLKHPDLHIQNLKLSDMHLDIIQTDVDKYTPTIKTSIIAITPFINGEIYPGHTFFYQIDLYLPINHDFKGGFTITDKTHETKTIEGLAPELLEKQQQYINLMMGEVGYIINKY